MDAIFSPCEGLDVHKKRVTACLITPDSDRAPGRHALLLESQVTLTVHLILPFKT